MFLHLWLSTPRLLTVYSWTSCEVSALIIICYTKKLFNPPKHYRLVLLVIVAYPEWMVVTYCWRHHSCISLHMVSCWYYLGASFLLAIFHNTRRYHEDCWWGYVINVHIHLWILHTAAMTCMARYICSCNISRNVMKVITWFLIGFKAHYTWGIHVLYLQSHQEFMVDELTCPIVEPNTIIC